MVTKTQAKGTILGAQLMLLFSAILMLIYMLYYQELTPKDSTSKAGV